MTPPSIESDDEAFEDALCRLSLMGTRDEAKAATERFISDAISKADKHASFQRHNWLRSLDDFFYDLSELPGLCAWHSRKLERILSLVRADDCNIGMIQALEKPLTDFFSGGFGDDFIISPKDYTFYADIKIEECTENEGVDSDILHWAARSVGIYDDMGRGAPGQMSGKRGSTTVDTLTAVEAHLKNWKCRIHSRSTKSKFQETKFKITHFFSNDKTPNGDDSRDKTSLGASREEFESLIDSMQTLVGEIKKKLPTSANVTSSRHERKLIVLQDDIRLQVKLANGLGLAIMRWSDLTPYQRAQALEVRVKDWAQHEMEWCRFRDEIRTLVKKKKSIL